MVTINYADIKFLAGIEPPARFERDLEIVKSFSKEILSNIFDFIVDNYARDAPSSEDDFKEFAQKISEHPARIERAGQFILYTLTRALDEKETIEEFERDLVQLGLNEEKDIFINKFNYYKNKLMEKASETYYRYFSRLVNCEWRLEKCLSVSNGKLPDKIIPFITIVYRSLDDEPLKLTLETDIPALKAFIMNLELCLIEAKKWQETT